MIILRLAVEMVFWVLIGSWLLQLIVKKLLDFKPKYTDAIKVTFSYSIIVSLIWYPMFSFFGSPTFKASIVLNLLGLVIGFFVLWLISSKLIKTNDGDVIGYKKGLIVTFDIYLLYFLVYLFLFSLPIVMMILK